MHGSAHQSNTQRKKYLHTPPFPPLKKRKGEAKREVVILVRTLCTFTSSIYIMIFVFNLNPHFYIGVPGWYWTKRFLFFFVLFLGTRHHHQITSPHRIKNIT